MFIYRGTAAGLADAFSRYAGREQGAAVLAYAFDEKPVAYAWRLRATALAKAMCAGLRALGEPAGEGACMDELARRYWPGRKPTADDLDAAEAWISNLFTP